MFVVNKSEIEAQEAYTKKCEYVKGLELTLRPSTNKNYQRAIQNLTARSVAEQRMLEDKPLQDGFFDGVDDGDSSYSEMFLRAIARFLIADWTVSDADGEKLPITGDNFLALAVTVGAADGDDGTKFVNWVFEQCQEAATEKTKAQAEVKKKPSRATNGKKETPKADG